MPTRSLRTLAALALAALPLGTLGTSGSVAGVANDSTAAILSKHAAYVGRPQGLVLTYRYTPSPKATAAPTPAPAASPEPSYPPYTLTIYRRGALYRQLSQFSGITRQEGFTGRAFWSANMNGFTVINYEKAARRLLTANEIDGDLLGADAVATSRGTQKVDGVDVDVVRITPANGIPAEIAFDRSTGGYVQVTYDPDDPYEKQVIHVDGYTEVAPGIRVPAGFHTGSGDRGSEKLVEKAVRAVTNDDLRGPVPTARWNFASTDTSPIQVVKYQSRLRVWARWRRRVREGLDRRTRRYVLARLGLIGHHHLPAVRGQAEAYDAGPHLVRGNRRRLRQGAVRSRRLDRRRQEQPLERHRHGGGRRVLGRRRRHPRLRLSGGCARRRRHGE